MRRLRRMRRLWRLRAGRLDGLEWARAARPAGERMRSRPAGQAGLGWGARARWTWAAAGRGRGLGTPWADPGGKCVGKGGAVDERHPVGPAPVATKLESMNNLHPNLVLTAKYCKLQQITTDYGLIRIDYYRLLRITTDIISILQITAVDHYRNTSEY